MPSAPLSERLVLSERLLYVEAGAIVVAKKVVVRERRWTVGQGWVNHVDSRVHQWQ